MANLIKFERSDGSSTRWPQGWTDEYDATNDNFNQRLKLGDAKYELWVSRIGAELAKLQGKPKQGYALFLHWKRQSNGEHRSDPYLYGSLAVMKFRSPNEFFGHAAWLFDESKELSVEKHAEECTCRYTKGFTPAPPVDSKRKTERQVRADNSSKRPKTAAAQKLSAEKREHKRKFQQVENERANDLEMRYWYRVGELIWYKIPQPFSRPPSASASASTFTSFQLWPGVVVSVEPQMETKPFTDPASSASGAYDVLHRYRCAVNLFGRIRMESVGVSEKYFALHEDLLPFNAIDVAAKISEVNQELARITSDFTQIPKAADSADGEWDKHFYSSMRTDELRHEDNWDKAVVHYAMALNLAEDLNRSWMQPDGYESTTEQQDGEGNSIPQSNWQGAWLGAERIWRGDLVRIKKSRAELPTLLGEPSPGAVNRGVFLRCNTLGCTPLEPGADGQPVASCQGQGDLYELAEEAWLRDNDSRAYEIWRQESLLDAPQTNGTKSASSFAHPMADLEIPNTEGLVRLPRPPKGYAYRKLNEDNTEVTCDFFDLAGRPYPDLDLSPCAKAFAPAARVQCLQGLADPLRVVADISREGYRGSRKECIIQANESAKNRMDRFFLSARQGKVNGKY